MLRGDRDRQPLRQRRYDILQDLVQLVRKLDVDTVRSHERWLAVLPQRDQEIGHELRRFAGQDGPFGQPCTHAAKIASKRTNERA